MSSVLRELSVKLKDTETLCFSSTDLQMLCNVRNHVLFQETYHNCVHLFSGFFWSEFVWDAIIDVSDDAALVTRLSRLRYPHKLRRLNIAGEQRRHLQAIDIRSEQGMMDSGHRWFLLSTLPRGMYVKSIELSSLCWFHLRLL